MYKEGKRTILLVWKEPQTLQRYVVGKLIHNEENNTDSVSYLSENFPIFPDLGERYESKSRLFPALMNHLPNKKRPNYIEILLKYILEPASSNMGILGATRGRLGTDNFEFVPTENRKRLLWKSYGV